MSKLPPPPPPPRKRTRQQEIDARAFRRRAEPTPFLLADAFIADLEAEAALESNLSRALEIRARAFRHGFATCVECVEHGTPLDELQDMFSDRPTHEFVDGTAILVEVL